MADKRIFAYTYEKDNLTAAVITAYENSLIFIGEEQQIYVPRHNAYVGIGLTSYTNLSSYVTDLYKKVGEVEAATTGNVVTSLNGIRKDIIINGNSSTGDNVFKIGEKNDKQFDNFESGITVSNNVTFNYTGSNFDASGLFTTDEKSKITYKDGIYTASNLSKESLDKIYGSADITNITSSITIDDKKTKEAIEAAITYSTSYSATYASNYTDKAINTLYHEILGEEYVVVDSPYSATNTNGYYVKLLPTSITNGNEVVNTTAAYLPVSLGENNEVTKGTWTNLSYSITTINYTDGVGNNDKTTYDKKTYTFTDETTLEGLWLEKNNDNKYVIYTKYNSTVDIASGINTIKEISYILDIITDGSEDDAISLTYNIASNAKDIIAIKKILSDISNGNGAVTYIQVNNSNNTNYVELAYESSASAGDNKGAGGVKLTAYAVVANSVDEINVEGISASTDETAYFKNNDASVYQINGDGLVTSGIANSYVAHTYNLLVETIKVAKNEVSTYAHYIVDSINYDIRTTTDGTTTYAINAINSFAITPGLGETPQNGHSFITAKTIDDTYNGDYTIGQYVKEVKQINGKIQTYYAAFHTYSTTVSELDNTNVHQTYNYSNLTVEGDVIKLTSKTKNIEDATSYGFIADAYAVNQFVSYVVSWAVIG